MTARVLMVVIVDKDKGDFVVEQARSAGAEGATIVPGRGAGVPDELSAFHITYEPEKEVVLMVFDKEKEEEVGRTIGDAINVEAPGTGLIFTIDVNQSSGLYQE